MAPWDVDHPLPKRLGPFRLSATRVATHDDSGSRAVLHVLGPGGAKADLRIEVAFTDVFATLGVGRLDPDTATPQLLVTSYTGGAHCCVHIQLLDVVGGRPRVVDIGTFDGEPWRQFPTDVDGDRVADLRLWDDRFAYAFGCYACSWMPPRIFNVRQGRSQDVSAAPRYGPLFVKDYADAKAECLKHSNPACVALVADGYRLGQQDEAWTLALANFDPRNDWRPPGCKVKAPPGKCPDAQQFKAEEFRPASAKFLVDLGIAPSAEADSARVAAAPER